MNNSDSPLRSIFADALEIDDAQQRAAFLDRACGTDTALRLNIEELIRAQALAGRFLPDQPGVSDAQGVLLQGAEALASATGRLQVPITEKPGDVIGRYKLLQQIGEGGCGVVYMAEQQEPIRRKVALKVIKLGMDTKSVVARFEAERQALALMDHTNIAKVLDAGATTTGRPFFVMELVRGTRITHYCDQNKLSTRDRLELFIQVCQAVQHAHQKGIIHRDLKPSNILVTVNDGVAVPKVIDFGIAKATEGRLADQTLFTAFEQFLGTPAYMSPEQAAMTSLDIDTRSDIYSLGVLLYELLTGKPPFDTRELVAAGLDELRRTIREREPSRPSTRLSTLLDGELTTTARQRGIEAPKLIHLLRGDLDWIVMKCLEKDRARRYDTANGLAKDIQRHLSCEPVLASPPSRLYEFRKTVRRHKVGFAAAAAIILALAVGVLVSTAEAVRAKRAEREQSSLREREQRARVKADAQERIARQRAYAADMNLLQQALGEKNFGRAQELLNHQRPEPGQEDLRGWEWRYLWQYCQSDALYELCQLSNAVSSMAVSPDGKWLAIGEHSEGQISVWDLRKRRQVARWQGAVGEVICAFSPREPRLAFSMVRALSITNWETNIRFWNPETGEMGGEELALPAECRCIGFSADGRTLSTFTTDDRLTLWRMPEGKRLATFHTPLQQGMDPPLAAALSPDAHFAAYTAPDGWVRVLDLVTGEDRWTARGADEFIWALAISPEGRTIASLGSSMPALRLWDLASGKEIAHTQEDNYGGLGGVVFWPDGRRMASVHANQTIRLYDISDPVRIRPLGRPLRGHQMEIWSLALLPDQATLVSGSKDGSVWLWDGKTSREDEMAVTLPAAVLAWRFAPDSRSVLALDQQGHVAKWQGAGFQDGQTLFAIGTNILQANFSNDGQLLAVAPTNGLIQIWDVSHGVLLSQFAASTKRMVYNSPGLLFLARGRKLLILDPQDTLHEWDLTTWQEIQSWPGPTGAMTVAVSPDEAWCLTLGRSGSRCPTSLRALTRRQEMRQNLNMASVEDTIFSPDGKLFAAASSFGGAKLWETATLHETAPLSSFLNATFSLCFSPDGRRLAIGSGGGEAIMLWDVESRQQVAALAGDGSMFCPTAFSPDGETLGSMSYKGLLHLWHAPSWEQIALTEQGQKAVHTP